MKQNLFDTFDYYDPKESGETNINTKPINIKSVMSQVQAKSGVEFNMRKHRKIHMTRFIAGITAAAVLVLGSTTMVAAAKYDGLDNFFKSLFDDNVPENTEALESYVTTPTVNFNSTNEDVQWSLLGMYGDDNCAMLSFSVTIKDGESLAEYLKTAVTFDMTDSNGNAEEINSYVNTWGNLVTLKKSADNSNIYYANFPLYSENLSGKVINLTFHNIYNKAQINSIQEQYLDMDNELQKEYCINELGITEEEWNSLEDGKLPEGFDIDAWKTYREENNLDNKSASNIEECYKNGENIFSGDWNAEITLDFDSSNTISTEYDGGTVTLNNMSATIEYPKDLESVEFVFTLKDGRKFTTTYFDDGDEESNNAENIEYLEKFIQNVDGCKGDTTDIYIPISELYSSSDSENNTADGITICYNEPISPENIAEVRAVYLEFDENAGADSLGGYCVTDEEVIYTAK